MAGKMTAKPIKFAFVNEKAKEPGGSQECDALKMKWKKKELKVLLLSP